MTTIARTTINAQLLSDLLKSLIIISCFVICSPVFAWESTAHFTGKQRVAPSPITGRQIRICTYQYFGKEFEVSVKLDNMCPPTTPVE